VSRKSRVLTLPLGAAVLFLSAAASHAQLAPIMFADWFIKKTTKEALATPGHAEWCAQSRPGYRKQWNNWRTPDGRVTYCSSPYFTVPWHVKTQ
jgi:hypothetical protein